MLVLSRRSGEKLQIGDNVTVTVVRIRGNRVRIGIDAPDHVRVVRSELDPWKDRPRSAGTAVPSKADDYLLRTSVDSCPCGE